MLGTLVWPIKFKDSLGSLSVYSTLDWAIKFNCYKFHAYLTLVVSFMATLFRIESTVRGHHVFKDVWTPYINKQLDVHIEEGNAFDEHAVAVWKDGQVVGHLPREIATTCWYFLRKRNSRIVCKITGHRHLSEIRRKGLVVPCIYTFEGKQNHIQKPISVFANKL